MKQLLILALLSASLGGCGPSFTMQVPDRFVRLEEDARGNATGYVQRATTPDGVVLGLRAIPHRVRGSLEFWHEAIVRRLRDQEGYAVLSEADTRAANGQVGKLVRLGRDLNGHAFRYTIAIFVADEYLWVVDAGGRESAYVALESDIERSITELRF